MSLRIDRASFLALTFGMAGLACNPATSPVVASVVEIPVQPPQPGDAGAPVAAASIEDPDAKPRAVSASDGEDDGDEYDIVSPDAEGGGVVRVSPRANANGCGWVDPKTVVRPAASCRDDQGKVGSCNAMKSCSGFAFPKQKCEAYRKLLKPRVAQKALDCLAKLSTKQTCDACNAYRCGDLAMKSACPDASVDRACIQITAKCGAVSMTECKLYMAGLNAAGRVKMVSCLTGKSGCGFGIYSCSEGLF